MSIAPATPQRSNGRLASRRATHATVLIAILGWMAFAGRAHASTTPLTGGLMLADTSASAESAALPIAPSPIATSDVGTDSLAGSGIACIIVTLAALASGGGDDKKKGRGRTRTDE